MKGIKCQLCDGFIINGRCKVCGMPYRNDEVLYHLNESRHNHYKHATPKAREMMRESVIPLGDKPSNNRSDQNKNLRTANTVNRAGRSASAQNTDRLMSKEQIKAQQEKIRQEAMAKINATKVPERNVSVKKVEKKKGIGGFWWILIAIYIIMGLVGRNL